MATYATYKGQRVQVIGESHISQLHTTDDQGHAVILQTPFRLIMIKYPEETRFHSAIVPENELAEFVEVTEVE